MEKEYKGYTAQDKEKVVSAGGLMVIGTERHESRRIDNQLRGRSGRYVGHCRFSSFACGGPKAPSITVPEPIPTRDCKFY